MSAYVILSLDSPPESVITFYFAFHKFHNFQHQVHGGTRKKYSPAVYKTIKKQNGNQGMPKSYSESRGGEALLIQWNYNTHDDNPDNHGDELLVSELFAKLTSYTSKKRTERIER